MFTRVRWPVMVAAWLIAVVLITLLTSRVIHVVGRQLTSAVSLPRPQAAGAPGLLPPQTVLIPPTTRQRPRPPSSPASGASAAAGGAGSLAAAGPAVTPPSGTTTSAGHRPIPAPLVSRPASRPPTVTDQRVVQTAGGQAAFTCTSSDLLTLLYATPAPGYTAEPPRVRSASRMDVIFNGAQEQKIDARCSDGHLQADVEV